jgi:hypothetical protein
VKIWHAFLDSLDERGLLDWDEVFVDASFSPAKKGGTESAKRRGKGYKVAGGGGWSGSSTRMPDRKCFAC